MPKWWKQPNTFLLVKLLQNKQSRKPNDTLCNKKNPSITWYLTILQSICYDHKISQFRISTIGNMNYLITLVTLMWSIQSWYILLFIDHIHYKISQFFFFDNCNLNFISLITWSLKILQLICHDHICCHRRICFICSSCCALLCSVVLKRLRILLL